jgi:hypothetical protein
MPRELSKPVPARGMCRGGMSMNCGHSEHARGKVADVYCRRCKARMGCSACCEIPSELVCLNCRDWARPAGLLKHGPMVAAEKVYPQIERLWLT